jgi:hypothetical protein
MSLNTFHDELQSDIIATAQGVGGDKKKGVADFRENAFTEIVTEDLSVAGVLESPVACHFEGGSGSAEFKVNGYGIPEEDSRLDLFVTLFFPQGDVQKVNSADIDRAFRKLLRFAGAALTPEFRNHIEPGSDSYAMVSEILTRGDEFDRIRLYLLTNGSVTARKEAERAGSFKDYKLSYEIWDLERFRRLRSSGVAQEPIAVDLTRLDSEGIPCVSVTDHTLGYKTCVALFPGSLLHDLYDEYGARLLELNVRSYLQARGKINKGILETLIREPHRFLAYNNGITVVAEEIKFAEGGTRLLSIRGMQIVNGGQTTASIHRARKESKADLSHVYVQAKLTVVPAAEFEEMVPEISRFSNTQNKVSEVDLRANNAYHIGIERISRRLWTPGEQSKWFYERARGSYQTERAKRGTTAAMRQKFDREYPPTKRFTKEDLARYVNSWTGLPYLVSRGGQKNFVRFMEGVPAVTKGWDMPADEFKELVGKAILYRETQALARELGIPSFRIQIVSYTVSLVADMTARRVNLLKLWETQGLPRPLKSLISDWLPKVGAVLTESVGNRNPTEWFKSEQCWKHLRGAAEVWQLSDAVKVELAKAGTAGVSITHDVENNIARCLAVNAETWFKVQIWGAESGKLEPWQCGIANTLSGYAAGGWHRKPSEKQAKYGVEILSLAEGATAPEAK